MIIQDRKFLVYGLGKTGKSLVKFVLENGGRVAVFDKNLAVLPNEIANLSVENRIGTKKKELLEGVDVLILSPGVSIHDDIVKHAISQKVAVLSEMDFAFEYLSGGKIGITASGGKSTTTKLIYEMLKEEYSDVRIGGNYGTPICELCYKSTPSTISVLEISSFMLEQSKTFHFDVAIFGNISKNHLDRHKSMGKYMMVKGKIARGTTSLDIVIIPEKDDKIQAEISKNFHKIHKPKVIKFQRMQQKNNQTSPQKNGKCPNRVENSWVYVADKQVLNCEGFTALGGHNLENLLVACIVAKHFGISDKSIEKTFKNFQPLPHRFERISEKNGVTYINDSKSTSAVSCETTLEMVDFPCVLMIGGSEKSDTFFGLFEKIKGNPFVVKTVIYGSCVGKLQSHAKSIGYHNYQRCENFESAFHMAKSLCVSGSTLLFSPACPSYDEFDNFEKRGDAFKGLVLGDGDE